MLTRAKYNRYQRIGMALMCGWYRDWIDSRYGWNHRREEARMDTPDPLLDNNDAWLLEDFLIDSKFQLDWRGPKVLYVMWEAKDGRRQTVRGTGKIRRETLCDAAVSIIIRSGMVDPKSEVQYPKVYADISKPLEGEEEDE